MLLSYEKALKMLKIDICITVIGQAVLEIFHFKADIPRKSPRIRISLKDVRGWQFLTMKAAGTLCIVCLQSEEHIS